MTSSTRILIEEDCTILLERALLRQTLVAFGEDGCGQHGQSDVPHYFDVVDIRVDVAMDDDDSPLADGMLSICLRGYDHRTVGHIMTDRNFDISLNAALTAGGIPIAALKWASISEQVDGCVTFYLDIGLLLGWS